MEQMQPGRAMPVQVLTKKRTLCGNVDSNCVGVGCRGKTNEGNSQMAQHSFSLGPPTLECSQLCALCFATGPKAHPLESCPLMLKQMLALLKSPSNVLPDAVGTATMG